VQDPCECGNVPSDSTQCLEIREKLHNCRLLKKLSDHVVSYNSASLGIRI
jgi:hypothetical protein